MRYEPARFHPEVFTDTCWLSDSVVRLRFAPGRVAPAYLDALLHGRSAPEVMPNAPNRDGIAQMLADVQRRFEIALRVWHGEAPETPGSGAHLHRDPLTRLRRWLGAARAAKPAAPAPAPPEVHPARRMTGVEALIHRTLAHMVDPHAIFANGSRTMTLVELEDGRFELAQHGDLRELIDYCSPYSACLPLRHEQCSWYSDADAAETAAYAQLRVIPWTELALADPRSGAPIGGSAWLQSQSRDRRWCIRSVAGETEVHVGWEGEPRDALRALDLGGSVVRCCASCAHLRFSGMSHQMSNGTTGYCDRRMRAAQARGDASSPLNERYGSGRVVGVLDLCSAWCLHDELRPSDR